MHDTDRERCLRALDRADRSIDGGELLAQPPAMQIHTALGDQFAGRSQGAQRERGVAAGAARPQLAARHQGFGADVRPTVDGAHDEVDADVADHGDGGPLSWRGVHMAHSNMVGDNNNND
jgi:hypothetical protein